MTLALDRLKQRGVLKAAPIRDQIAAISVGHVDGELALDLCYAEDSIARVDLNVVGTGRGGIVEIQGTAEGEALPRPELDRMVDLALEGVKSLVAVEDRVLADAGVELGRLMPG
jgi:ribonuclease PH